VPSPGVLAILVALAMVVSVGTVAARSSAMGRPGSSAVWIRLPPRRRHRQPARLAACLDRA
jgi:hypothetical protein